LKNKQTRYTMIYLLQKNTINNSMNNNIIFLKGRQIGKSYSNLKYFEWQKEYLRYNIRYNRKQMIKSIFNI
jgi:hypothetical protein